VKLPRKTACPLLDNLDDPVGPRVHKDGAAVHDRIAIIAHAVFLGYLVIGNAVLGQNGTDAHILPVLVGRPPLFDDIGTETGTLIDTQHAGDAADDTTHHAADNSAYGASRPLAIARPAFDATRYALGLGDGRNRDCENNDSSSD